MKRIIIHGLKLEFQSFVAAIQGWPIQPSITEFENLLAGQEALVKQMSGDIMNTEEDVVYARKGKIKLKSHSNQNYRHNPDKRRNDGYEKKIINVRRENNLGKRKKSRHTNKGFLFKFHKCGRSRHMARDCCLEPLEQGNTTTTQHEEVWDA